MLNFIINYDELISWHRDWCDSLEFWGMAHRRCVCLCWRGKKFIRIMNHKKITLDTSHVHVEIWYCSTFLYNEKQQKTWEATTHVSIVRLINWIWSKTLFCLFLLSLLRCLFTIILLTKWVEDEKQKNAFFANHLPFKWLFLKRYERHMCVPSHFILSTKLLIFFACYKLKILSFNKFLWKRISHSTKR